MMNIIMMGPQGSGKSTQAELLAEQLGMAHLEAGELLHYLSQVATPQGRAIKKIMASGQLVGDELMVKIIKQRLAEPQYQNGFVLDGFPRVLSQARQFDAKIERVFYLQVSDQEGVKRLLKRKRADDTAATIQKRLLLYHQETEPVLDFYRSRGVLTTVDGERSVEAIHQDILKRIKR
ncbi:adenylate kinase [Candidatus Shapirobacteria bacterium CG10_big_fil_rev_8_21_14_0_10_48_15]|uniref:Adenylate kinase n=1 Tax=Candidatus Shapirobacteria bacterium CG10_big_fil_rev_8_21_14_0_10_48_15 TaxID=1974484 RepID=A0A2M8L6T4_9BACT|nr:MAG: adenylate kinase [Candidatus Shapirobacteria bacterium CG10_big_fil_rev_8_21_14_0_10_48_15]